jgi:hypothetical protein
VTSDVAGRSIHIDLDGAWSAADVPFATLDFRGLGPSLRYTASGAELDQFNQKLPSPLPPFMLYGSGDFHHLSALWLRRAIEHAAAGGDFALICFDNHPDWDVRPPRWGCGGWVNRALDLPAVRQAHVWGCGNFELAFPSRLFANRRALKKSRLVIHPWAERLDAGTRRRFDCMDRVSWKYGFERFAAGLRNCNIYVTVDLDCLSTQQAVTNWESGLFTAEEVAWAIGYLQQRAKIVGGDVCGAYSQPYCRGAFRRFASWWDHPKLPVSAPADSRRINLAALGAIWPALAGQA